MWFLLTNRTYIVQFFALPEFHTDLRMNATPPAYLIIIQSITFVFPFIHSFILSTFIQSSFIHSRLSYLLCSTMKSSFVLGLLLAFNNVYPVISHAYIVLLGGCFLASFKVWNLLRLKNNDPLSAFRISFGWS